MLRYEINPSDPVDLQESLKERDQLLGQLKGNFLKAQVYMKQQADKKKGENCTYKWVIWF